MKKEFEQQTEKPFPSHFGEVYDAMPDKFEKRKDRVKPALYMGLAVACVLLAIFPGWLPVMPLWMVRTAGIIGAVVLFLVSQVAGVTIYNKQSGGEVKPFKTKKFIQGATDTEKIVAAFERHDFEYLAGLPSGDNQPVQLHVEEDARGREFYCLLTTYTAGYKIVGLAAPVILAGEEYEKNKTFIKELCND